MAYYDDKTPGRAFDAQRPQIRRFWGLTTQVGCARLIIERCTKFISSGNSESLATASEMDHGSRRQNLRQLPLNKPRSRPGRFCFELARWQWTGPDRGFCSFGFVLIFPSWE